MQALLFILSGSVQLLTVLGGHLKGVVGGAEENATNSLLFVQVIARHGDRAPIHPYPTDPYQDMELYWPNGWYQLTQIGVQQELNLGAYLRQRYEGFLPPTYSHLDFLAHSSDNDRTIQSAEACVTGLYPSDQPRGGANWHPVPIHTIPTSSDIWIDSKSTCPKYVSLLGDLYTNSSEISQLNLDNQEFIQFIAEKSGIVGLQHVTDLNQVQDALRCEHFHNLTLPDWATDEVRAKLDHFKALTFVWKVQTYEMKRLKSGPMVGLFLDNFRAKVNGGGTEKMRMFFGHDSTISGVLATWNIFQPHIPPYASLLMLELHPSSTALGEPHVKVFYRNDSSREPYMLQIPGCGEPCVLSQLEELSRPFVPLDWDAECEVTSTPPKASVLSLSLEGEDALPSMSTTSPAIMAVAGVLSLLGAVVGSALLTNAYIKRGLARNCGGSSGTGLGGNYQALS